MAKTREAVASDGTTPKELGRRLKQVRAQNGLSRRQAARSAGLTRHELAGYERGRAPISGADLASIAGSCGVDPSDLLPGDRGPDEPGANHQLLAERDPLRVGSHLGSLTVGSYYVQLAPLLEEPEQPSGRGPGIPDHSERDQGVELAAQALLAEYLDLIAALRTEPSGGDAAGTRVTPDTVREPDLAVLADALERSPEAVETLMWRAPLASTSPEAPAVTDELLVPSWRFGTILSTVTTPDDRCRADRSGTRWALAQQDFVGPLTIEATVDLTGGPGFGLLVRAELDDRSRLSGYSFDVDVSVDGAYVLRYWERDEQHWWPLAHRSVSDSAHLFGRHLIRLDVEQDELHVAVDGTPLLSVPDLRACTTGAGVLPLEGGRAGFAVWGTSLLTVESFRVTRR